MRSKWGYQLTFLGVTVGFVYFTHHFQARNSNPKLRFDKCLGTLKSKFTFPRIREAAP